MSWGAWRSDGQKLERQEPKFQLPAALQLATRSCALLPHLSSICRNTPSRDGRNPKRWWEAAADVFALGPISERADLLNADDCMLAGSSAGRHDIPALMKSRGIDLSSCIMHLSMLGELLKDRSRLVRVAKEALGLELAGSSPEAGARLSYWPHLFLRNAQLERAINDAAP